MKADPLSVEHKTVGELVAADYRKAEVFKRFGIDFCCGGGRTVEEACQKKGIPYSTLENELLKMEQENGSSDLMNFHEWDARVLIDYILSIHHRYVRENIPLLKEFITKVARVHGHAHPEVVAIAALFGEVASELEAHMIKEEQILFPYIKRLAGIQGQNEPVHRPPFGTVRNPITMMELEHERAGEILAEIRRVSHHFTPPEHACTTYRVAYFKLEEFEADLHKHIHLENNILFPCAIALEQPSSSPS